MAEMQLFYPKLFPPYGYSVDSDAEDHGELREQPETAAILSCMQPRCVRYFRSGCHDVLQWWCPMFALRFIFSTWVHFVGEEYGRRCMEGSTSLRLQREGYARTASEHP